ncbi:hypothetical protein H4582DRAFT_1400130 [Lactarius indigo]|nr:hypothetical protein H4582DRAFT_1400130 [Lactarius indigo]
MVSQRSLFLSVIIQAAKHEAISRNHFLHHRLNLLRCWQYSLFSTPCGHPFFQPSHRFLLGFDGSLRVFVCCYPLVSFWTSRILMPHSRPLITPIIRVVFRSYEQFLVFRVYFVFMKVRRTLLDAVTYRLYMELTSPNYRLRILLLVAIARSSGIVSWELPSEFPERRAVSSPRLTLGLTSDIIAIRGRLRTKVLSPRKTRNGFPSFPLGIKSDVILGPCPTLRTSSNLLISVVGFSRR